MSEVSIDKVMTDINSFRQRLTMLREELGRANRAMADKMSQLGETLTQRVRDLRDQVTNAPQNLLTKNLRNIDEIRSLLLIMSQLDARPTTQGPQGPSMMGRPSSPD